MQNILAKIFIYLFILEFYAVFDVLLSSLVHWSLKFNGDSLTVQAFMQNKYFPILNL